MKSLIITLSIIVYAMFFNNYQAQAQSDKVDFNAEWKADSVNNVIQVTIINGDPNSVMIYDKSPFDNGILLSKTDLFSKKKVEIITEKKIKLCVCVVKDAINFNCKWLVVEK